MVSAVTAVLSLVFGLMLYVLIAVGSIAAPVTIRNAVGTFYLKLGAKSLKQFTFVRRVLSGYDILPISVDDEQKLLQVTLSSSTLGEDNEYRFADPDNRIGRLFSKPVAIAFERVPAALDAELAEWGHHVAEKEQEEGLLAYEDGEKRVDPYVQTDDALRLVDPVDVFNLVSNDVDSENIKTAEKITKKRYEKYNDGVDMAQTLRVLMSFAVGAGGVMIMHYINSEFIGGSGGGVPGGGIVDSETLMLSPLWLVDSGVLA